MANMEYWGADDYLFPHFPIAKMLVLSCAALMFFKSGHDLSPI